MLLMTTRTIRHCRRDAAMQRQRDARRDLTSHARVLALGGNGGDHDDAAQVAAEAADGAMLSTFGTEGGRFSDAEENDGDGAAQSMGELEDLAGAASGRQQPRRSPGKWSRQSIAAFSAQFMHPEWLVDVPPDLASAWYVTPRPSGQRQGRDIPPLLTSTRPLLSLKPPQKVLTSGQKPDGCAQLCLGLTRAYIRPLLGST